MIHCQLLEYQSIALVGELGLTFSRLAVDLVLPEEIPLSPVLYVRVDFEIGNSEHDKGNDAEGKGSKPVGGDRVSRVFAKISGGHTPGLSTLV